MFSLCALSRLLVLGLALAQTLTGGAQTLTNPAFEQDIATFDIQQSGKTTGHNISIALSQDFQTVYAGNDANGQQQGRVLLDFSTCCPSSNSSQDILDWATNTKIPLLPLLSVPKIALIKRGNCQWSNKVNLAKQISTAKNLTISAILIYDNTARPDANFTLQQLSAENTITLPKYPNKLTSDRQIWQMQDNDIASAVVDMPVYFAPYDYGEAMLSLLNSTAQSLLASNNNTQLQVWQLTSHLTYLQASDNDSTSSYPPVSTSGFLSYAIALAIIFLLAVLAGLLVMRWKRIRQEREQQDLDLHARNSYRLRRVQPLPPTILHSFPVTVYSVNMAKNSSCPICLEDFEQDITQVRTLPCNHCFCVTCIDPWLTSKSTLCPICKHNCLPEELRRHSVEEEDAEAQTTDSLIGGSSENMRRPELDGQQCVSPSTGSTDIGEPNNLHTTTELQSESLIMEAHNDTDNLPVKTESSAENVAHSEQHEEQPVPNSLTAPTASQEEPKVT